MRASVVAMRRVTHGSEVSGLPSNGPAPNGAVRRRARRRRRANPDAVRAPPRTGRAQRGASVDRASAIIGEVSTETLERAAPAVRDAQHDRRRPWNDRGRSKVAGNAAPARRRRRRRDRARRARNRRYGPCAVLQLPLRAALAAPIQRRDGEAAAEEVADRLEIFLDEFGAAAEQRHGAARLLRRPMRRPQIATVDRMQRIDDRLGGTRLSGVTTRREADYDGFGVLWRVVAHGKARAGRWRDCSVVPSRPLAGEIEGPGANGSPDDIAFG